MKPLDKILFIGMRGDSVCELIALQIDGEQKKILVSSLTPLFRSKSDSDCPEASYRFLTGGVMSLASYVSQTAGQTFEKYVLFTYQVFMQAIDILGGLNLELSEAEADPLNVRIEKLCRSMGEPVASNLIRSGADNYQMNGLRTAAFLNLADVLGDSPSRTRRFLSALKVSLKNANAVVLSRLGKMVISSVRTNIPGAVILSSIMNIRDYAGFRLETH